MCEGPFAAAIPAMIRTLVRASRRAPLVRQRARLSSLNLSAICSDPALSSKTAIIDDSDKIRLSYKALNEISAVLAAQLVGYADGGGKGGSVAAFNKTSTGFVVSMLAAWKLGRVFVPLCIDHSESELSYVLNDSKVAVVCCSSKSGVNEAFLKKCPVPVFETGRLIESHATIAAGKNGLVLGEGSKEYLSEPVMGAEDGALVIYTSGTTGSPKGVLHTHSSVYHMVKALVQAWRYNETDRILHFLPLYHVHGLVNKLLCVLSAGGTVDFLHSASAPVVWSRLAEEERLYQQDQKDAQDRDAQDAQTQHAYAPLTLFMAVPTVYARLLERAKAVQKVQASEAVGAVEEREDLAAAVAALSRMRLMACGSAALPDNVLSSWEELTGYRLLERYGMTEMGMALSNPYEGEHMERRMGTVGQPLPFVSVRLVDDNGHEVVEGPGELRVKGPNMFREYLNRPEATAESFDEEGWFRTGDVAQLQDGYYKILGRNSTDIIKVCVGIYRM